MIAISRFLFPQTFAESHKPMNTGQMRTVAIVGGMSGAIQFGHGGSIVGAEESIFRDWKPLLQCRNHFIGIPDELGLWRDSLYYFEVIAFVRACCAPSRYCFASM
jgi:hypothetical protein